MSFMRLKNVDISYKLENTSVRAVRSFSCDIERGDIVGIVGESGSGKSTLALGIMRLLPPNASLSAETMLFDGRNILSFNQDELRKIRWKEISVVFQKAMNALSPVHKIFTQMYDVIIAHSPDTSKGKAYKMLTELFSKVNLPSKVLNMYPHELSGGMMQRVMITMSLIHNPKMIIFDEVTTALDVITQGQLLDEINRLVREFGLTAIIITHDIGVVNEVCNKVAVMYAGELLEFGKVKDVIFSPMHPYTKALVKSHPDLRIGNELIKGIPGSLPDLTDPPGGCIFYPRCDVRLDLCKSVKPEVSVLGDRIVKCHRIQR
ncbi:MAG: ABC transporter ATP-binding protein [Thermotoga sp.]|nr:MAG: ABC transporter ATP-binding protein [Thermotoga sp.]